MNAFLDLAHDLWDWANDHAGWVVAVVLGWIAAIVVASVTGHWALTAAITLAGTVAVIVLVAFMGPLWVWLVAQFGGGRAALQYLMTTIGTLICVGLYFAIVPTHRDPGLVLILILAALAIAAFGFGFRENRVVRNTISVLTLGIVVITAIFLLGGRQNAVANGQGLIQAVRGAGGGRQTPQPPVVQHWTLNAGQELNTTSLLAGEGARWTASHAVEVWEESRRWRQVSAGEHTFTCDTPGRLLFRGLHNGTRITTERR